VGGKGGGGKGGKGKGEGCRKEPSLLNVLERHREEKKKGGVVSSASEKEGKGERRRGKNEKRPKVYIEKERSPRAEKETGKRTCP